MQRKLSPSAAEHREVALAKAKELARDYATTFGTPQGANVLNDLVTRFYDAKLLTEDPMRTGHRIGRRDVVAFIRDMVNGGESDRTEVTDDE